MNQKISMILTKTVELEQKRKKVYEMIQANQKQSRPNQNLISQNKIQRQAGQIKNSVEGLKRLVDSHLQKISKERKDEKVSFQKKIKPFLTKIQYLQKQNGVLNQKLIKNQQQNKNLKRELNEANLALEKSKAKNENVKIVRNKLARLKFQISEYKTFSKALKNQIAYYKKTINFNQINNRVKQLSLNISDLKSAYIMMEDCEKKYKNKEQQIKESFSAIISMVYNKCAILSKYINIPIFRKQDFNKQASEFFDSIINNFHVMNCFCDSKILTQNYKKQWLVKQLAPIAHLNSDNILSTNLLYRFDPLNKANFHNYFDGKPNIVILVQLSNGIKVGGFTYYPIEKQNTVKPGQGCLFSITESLIFKMKNQPPHNVAGYDQYYFILGNSELRIRSLQSILFSNFGINNSTFETYGNKKINFIGSEQQEVSLKTYEIYQIK